MPEAPSTRAPALELEKAELGLAPSLSLCFLWRPAGRNSDRFGFSSRLEYCTPLSVSVGFTRSFSNDLGFSGNA